MNNETALLAAIRARPRDDTLRLAYADFVQEQGDEERAECIRSSVAMGQMPEGSLLRNIATAPTGTLVSWHTDYYNLYPRRGLYEIVDCKETHSFDTHLGHYPYIEGIKQLKQAHPITGLVLKPHGAYSRAQLQHLLEHSATRGIWPSLNSIGLHLEPRAIAVLAESMDRFKHLDTLDLSTENHRRLYTPGARAIGRRAHQFRRLKCINLAGNEIGNEGVTELLRHAQEFRNLNSLDLAKNEINALGADHLAERMSELPKLRVLSLAGNPIRNAGVQTLMDHSRQLKGLESLDLSNCRFDVDGAVAIAAHIHELKGLKGLNLAYNELGSEGVVALCQDAVNLGGLQYLDLSNTGMDVHAAKSLARHGFEFRSLVMLRLNDKFYGSELASAEFPKLRFLEAGNSGENLRRELRWRRKQEAADRTLPIALPSLESINGTALTDDLLPPCRTSAPTTEAEKAAPAALAADKDVNVGILIPHATSADISIKP